MQNISSKGKPLTIEELKALSSGDWVWIERKDTNYRGYAMITNNFESELELKSFSFWKYFSYSYYGKTWIAYKNKEQAEEDRK